MVIPTHWNTLDSAKLKVLLNKPPRKEGLDMNNKSKGNVEKIRQTNFPHVPHKTSTTILGLNLYLSISIEDYQDHVKLR